MSSLLCNVSCFNDVLRRPFATASMLRADTKPASAQSLPSAFSKAEVDALNQEMDDLFDLSTGPLPPSTKEFEVPADRPGRPSFSDTARSTNVQQSASTASQAVRIPVTQAHLDDDGKWAQLLSDDPIADLEAEEDDWSNDEASHHQLSHARPSSNRGMRVIDGMGDAHEEACEGVDAHHLGEIPSGSWEATSAGVPNLNNDWDAGYQAMLAHHEEIASSPRTDFHHAAAAVHVSKPQRPAIRPEFHSGVRPPPAPAASKTGSGAAGPSSGSLPASTTPSASSEPLSSFDSPGTGTHAIPRSHVDPRDVHIHVHVHVHPPKRPSRRGRKGKAR